MSTFPLIRTKWSNESIMAALYGVLILYQIPIWISGPDRIVHFLLLTAAGLFIDAVFNLVKYKRLWCCVSAAVTAAIISLLAAGVPVWTQLIGLAAALVVGKYIWGGTGRNIINPAITGLLVIILISPIPYPFFASSWLFLPAIILSLPFLKVRPYAGIGLIAGMITALLVSHDLSIISIISSGAFFWGCIVLTDPVTVTRNRYAGLILTFAGGFIVVRFSPTSLTFAALILTINVLSYVLEDYFHTSRDMKSRINIPKAVSCNTDDVLDLTGAKEALDKTEQVNLTLDANEIIDRIKNNEVFGMGGAAFPTFKKIDAVRTCTAKEKYLIINGVECDPGLVHDRYILEKHADEIEKGVKILKNCIGFTSVYLAVSSAQGLHFANEIILHKTSGRYPEGAEKILIREILNRQLDRDQVPADCGILVLNVHTVYAVNQAVSFNRPADTRYLTTADLYDRTARIVKVKLGMKLKDIMEAAYPGRKQIFAGGGIMQSHSATEEDVVDKDINFIAASVFPRFKESPQCSKCGNCVAHCPAGLKVNTIVDLVDQGRIKDALRYNPEECISCGSCSYSCLAGRNLAEKVKKAKKAAVEKR